MAERRERVADEDHPAAGRRTLERLLHDDRPGAPPGRVGDEGVPVVRVAADGDEQLTRPERPAVGRDAGKARRVAERRQGPTRRRENLLEREDRAGARPLPVLGRDHRPSSSRSASPDPRARRTSSRSSR